jgi:hypothetical protein
MGFILELAALAVCVMVCPTVGGLVGLILMPLGDLLRRVSDSGAELLLSAIQGFTAFATGVLIFRLIGLTPNLSLLLVLGLAFLWNDWGRLSIRQSQWLTSEGEQNPVLLELVVQCRMQLVGDMAGLVAGAAFFLVQLGGAQADF